MIETPDPYLEWAEISMSYWRERAFEGIGFPNTGHRLLLRPRRAGRVTRDFFWTDHAMREQWHVYKGIGYHTRAQAAQAVYNETRRNAERLDEVMQNLPPFYCRVIDPRTLWDEED